MVFQHQPVPAPDHSGVRTVLAPIWVRVPKKEAEATAMHYLARVKIPEYAQIRASHGQQQRVAIARFIVHETAIVVR